MSSEGNNKKRILFYLKLEHFFVTNSHSNPQKDLY